MLTQRHETLKFFGDEEVDKRSQVSGELPKSQRVLNWKKIAMAAVAVIGVPLAVVMITQKGSVDNSLQEKMAHTSILAVNSSVETEDSNMLNEMQQGREIFNVVGGPIINRRVDGNLDTSPTHGDRAKARVEDSWRVIMNGTSKYLTAIQKAEAEQNNIK